MEGESPEPEQQPNPEREASPFLRVEHDGPHKIFVKSCTTCGHEFSTSIPCTFFLNPDDDSTTLKSQAKAMGVKKIIFNPVCPDAKRNTQAVQQNEDKESKT